MITTWGSLAISLFGVYTLAYWGSMPSLPDLVLSAIELMALLTVYGTLLPKPVTVSDAIPFVDIDTDIASLTPRVTGTLLIALALRTVLFGFVSFDFGAMLLASAAKALTWLFVMETVRHDLCLFPELFLICSGSKLFLDRSHCHQNFCHFRHTQSVHTIF